MNRLGSDGCVFVVVVVVVDGNAAEFGTQRLDDERVALGRVADHALRLGHRVGEGQQVLGVALVVRHGGRSCLCIWRRGRRRRRGRGGRCRYADTVDGGGQRAGERRAQQARRLGLELGGAECAAAYSARVGDEGVMGAEGRLAGADGRRGRLQADQVVEYAAEVVAAASSMSRRRMMMMMMMMRMLSTCFR